MANLVASTFIGSGSLWLYLDNKLIVQDSDSVTLELERNTEYILRWMVMGDSGASYSITISSPREAEYQLTKILVASGKDEGAFRFRA